MKTLRHWLNSYGSILINNKEGNFFYINSILCCRDRWGWEWVRKLNQYLRRQKMTQSKQPIRHHRTPIFIQSDHYLSPLSHNLKKHRPLSYKLSQLQVNGELSLLVIKNNQVRNEVNLKLIKIQTVLGRFSSAKTFHVLPLCRQKSSRPFIQTTGQQCCLGLSGSCPCAVDRRSICV